MEDRGMNSLRLTIIAMVIAALGIFAWSQYSARVEAENKLGFDASRILSEHFARAAAVKVATLSGEVIARGEDEGFLGIVPSKQRTRTPYSVDYFVDVSRLGPSSYRWNAESRILTIDIVDVTTGKPNVDESRAVSQQEGLFISRRASLDMARQASARAVAASNRTARKPDHMNRARANARAVITRIAEGPLAAAGLEDVRVAVSFPWERKAPAGLSGETMDGSRPIEDVLAERKAKAQ